MKQKHFWKVSASSSYRYSHSKSSKCARLIFNGFSVLISYLNDNEVNSVDQDYELQRMCDFQACTKLSIWDVFKTFIGSIKQQYFKIPGEIWLPAVEGSPSVTFGETLQRLHTSSFNFRS